MASGMPPRIAPLSLPSRNVPVPSRNFIYHPTARICYPTPAKPACLWKQCVCHTVPRRFHRGSLDSRSWRLTAVTIIITTTTTIIIIIIITIIIINLLTSTNITIIILITAIFKQPPSPLSPSPWSSITLIIIIIIIIIIILIIIIIIIIIIILVVVIIIIIIANLIIITIITIITIMKHHHHHRHHIHHFHLHPWKHNKSYDGPGYSGTNNIETRPIPFFFQQKDDHRRHILPKSNSAWLRPLDSGPALPSVAKRPEAGPHWGTARFHQHLLPTHPGKVQWPWKRVWYKIWYDTTFHTDIFQENSRSIFSNSLDPTSHNSAVTQALLQGSSLWQLGAICSLGQSSKPTYLGPALLLIYVWLILHQIYLLFIFPGCTLDDNWQKYIYFQFFFTYIIILHLQFFFTCTLYVVPSMWRPPN